MADEITLLVELWRRMSAEVAEEARVSQLSGRWSSSLITIFGFAAERTPDCIAFVADKRTELNAGRSRKYRVDGRLHSASAAL